jgi:hypothetical protein
MQKASPVDAAMQQAAALFAAGKSDEAQALCEAILRADGRHFYALHLLAALAAQRGEAEECVRLASRALEIDPNHAEVLRNRGAALRMLQRYEEALADYDRALEIAPGSAEAFNNRGVTLAALGRHAQALDAYEKAITTNPGNARAKVNRAVSRLMLGDFTGGWEDYESRWAGHDTQGSPRSFGVPEFTASDWNRGHRVALWIEQGVGDQLLFSTLATEVAARGQAFVLEVDRRLRPAFVRAHPDWLVVSPEQSQAAFADCDRHLPLGSLPRLVRPTRESFQRQPDALVAADADRAAQFRARFDLRGKRLIGISWRSFQPRMRAYYERRKSAPLDAFARLSQSPDVRLLDLQYGDTAAERAAFARGGGLLHRLEDLDLFNDLDGLLAAIEACDAVVTTSNVTAHLAGALGKRTLLVYLAANSTFHYWAADETGRSLWYPSVEVVTEAGLDTWDKALEVAGRLL